MRSTLRKLGVIVALSLLIIPSSIRAEDGASGTQRDTTTVQLPEKPGKSFGSYLLDVPEEILKSPVYVIKGVTWFAINGVYRNNTLRNIASQLVAFEPVEGFKPIFSYGDNKGVRYGAGWQLFNSFVKSDDLFFRASYSSNNYQKHSIRYIAPARITGDRGLRVLLQYQTRTRESFYGTGNSTSEEIEAAYYLEETQFNVDGIWQLLSDISVEINGGYIMSNTFDGDSPEDINSLDSIKTLFALRDADLRNSEFLQIGATIDHDWRDSKGQPSHGGREIVSISFKKGIGKSDDVNFISSRAEVTQYLNIHKKRLLAARVVVQSIDAEGATPIVPLQLRSGLGGVSSLRGYANNRFIDYDLTAAAIEYRWPIWNIIDAFIFAEAGRVYSSLTEEFTFKNWHECFGTGLRIWKHSGLILLLQGGVGDEGAQFNLELGGGW